MGQDYKDKNIAFFLIVSFLVGLVCGAMMLVCQQTEPAVEVKELLLREWALLSEQTDAVGMFVRLFVPGAVMLLLTFGFGLWLIGQPFLAVLYAAAGVLCGGYGAVLLQEKLWFFLLGYLPFVTIGFLLQLPVGVSGIRCSLSAKSRIKGYLFLLIRQILLLGFVCLAAVLCIRYAAGAVPSEGLRILP